MNRIDFKKFLQDAIKSQGSASSMALGYLADELLEHIPCVVNISDEFTTEDSSTVYAITNSQDEINAIIDDIVASEMPCIVIHDKGVTLHFNHIEADGDTVICYLATHDGLYTLTLIKEVGASDLVFTKS